MTISKDEPLFSGPYAGDGVTAVHDFNFRVYGERELIVEVVFSDNSSQVLLEGTHYTVELDTGGGTITLFDPATTFPAGSELTITPDIDVSQTRPFGTQSSISSAEFEAALDKNASIDRQLKGYIDRAIRLPVGSAASPELPRPAEDRALIWGAGGLENGPLASEVAGAADAAAAAAAARDAAEAARDAAQAAENSLLKWEGEWVTATSYGVGDIVEHNGTSYVCVTAHVSDAFSSDLGSGYWEVFAEKGDAGAGSGDMLNSENLSGLTDKALAFSRIKQDATTEMPGVVEKATGTEMSAGAAGKFPDAATIRDFLDAQPFWHYEGTVSYTGASQLATFTHGLGEEPALAQVDMVCLSPDAGYLIGDVLRDMSPSTEGSADRAHGTGMSVFSRSTTTLYVLASAYGIGARHATSGAVVSLTPTKWEFRVRARKGGVPGQPKQGAITPEDFDVDLTDAVTDQSAKLQDFFDWLANNPGQRGCIWGTARGQNIRIRDGVKCHSDGFTLIVPDDDSDLATVQTEHSGGWTAVTGFYNAGADTDGARLTDVRLTGTWRVESVDGTASATNGTAGAVFVDADDCAFGSWGFKGIPAGIMFGNCIRCVAGPFFGENMRGTQPPTRTGTGGTILNLYDCDGCEFGMVLGKEVWKPGIYCSPGYVGPSRDCKLAGVVQFSGASGEAAAFGARHLVDSRVGFVYDKGGIGALYLARNFYDNGAAADHRVHNVSFGTVISVGSYSPPPPFNSSLVAGVFLNSEDQSGGGDDGIVNTGIHIEHLILDGCKEYGVYRKRGDLTIDQLTVRSHTDTTRGVIYAIDNGVTRVRKAVVEDIAPEFVIAGNAAEVHVDDLTMPPNTGAASVAVFYGDGASVKMRAGIVRCTGTPDGVSTFAYDNIFYAVAAPLANLSIVEVVDAGWSPTYTLRCDGIDATAQIGGLPDYSIVPASGAFSAGDRMTVNSEPIWHDGTMWRGDLSGEEALTLDANGHITVNGAQHTYTVDTYSGAATDDLVRIHGGYDGQQITLRGVSASRVVTVNGAYPAGYVVASGGSFALDSPADRITLELDTSYGGWIETGRSDNA